MGGTSKFHFDEVVLSVLDYACHTIVYNIIKKYNHSNLNYFDKSTIKVAVMINTPTTGVQDWNYSI